MESIGEVKTAKIQNSDVLSMIYAECWRDTWKNIFPESYIEAMISRRNALWWAKNLKRATTPAPLLLDYQGETVGYINYGKSRYGDSGFEGEIYELNVLPHYQRIGVGTHLFQAARAALEKSDLLGLIAWSIKENERCSHFYMARGGTAFTTSTVRFNDRGILKEYDRIAFSWPAYV